MRTGVAAVVLGGTALCLLSPGAAGAVPVTWLFQSTVREFETGGVATVAPSELAALGVVAGATLSGILQFESSTPDSDASPTFGNYDGTVTSTQWNVGSVTLTLQATPPFNLTRVNTNLNVATHLLSLEGAPPEITGPLDISALELFGTGDDFVTDALPVVPPDLGDLTPYQFGFPTFGTRAITSFFVNDEVVVVSAELTLLMQIPEPGSGILAGSGLLGVALARRRRRSAYFGGMRSTWPG